MNREEALRQIEEIQSVLESSHAFPISIVHCISGGLTIFLLPFIELPTKYLFMGSDEGPARTLTSGLVHAVFYFVLFLLVVLLTTKILRAKEMAAPAPAHPLMKNVLKFHEPFAICMPGLIAMLIQGGSDRFIYPIGMLFLGTLLTAYGQFSHRLIRWLGWSYIVLGIVMGLMLKNENLGLWVYFNTYVGLSMTIVGFLVRKASGGR